MVENFLGMRFEIQKITSSTDFKHYGYFKYAVTVYNIDRKETFEVFYDKKMNRMEDSINLENQEKYLDLDIRPIVEKYIADKFGETRYITVSYDIATGKPMIVVTFKQNREDITQTDFDTFISFLKETIGLEHANVIVDYWTRE